MKKYRIVLKDDHSKWAAEMKEIYDLPYSIEEIVCKWEEYSREYFCAGWMGHSKEGIEACFNIELEAIDEEE